MKELFKRGTAHLLRMFMEKKSRGGDSAAQGTGFRPVSARPVLSKFAGRAAWCLSLLLLTALFQSAVPPACDAQVAVGVSVTIAPPPLPVYVQPVCPGPGYIWTPGYWAWDPYYGYYWVPGTWVLAPFPGALWTPGYWRWYDGGYVWSEGYWGPVVGFYGGIYYGFGYTGYGYDGGYWRHGTFYYNRVVNNINVTKITNVYSRPVSRHVPASHVSYNGGRGGATARPSGAQQAAARQRHTPPTGFQTHHQQIARTDPRQRAAVNHGRPDVAATPKPGVFTGRDVVRARRAGAPYKAVPQGRPSHPGAPAQAPGPAGRVSRPPAVPREHAAPQPRMERPAAPRGEPLRPGYRTGEPRPAQPHPYAAPPQGAPHVAPQRPGGPQPQPMGGGRHEEGKPHRE